MAAFLLCHVVAPGAGAQDAGQPTVEITGVPDYIKDTTPFKVTFAFSEDVVDFIVRTENQLDIEPEISDVEVTGAKVTDRICCLLDRTTNKHFARITVTPNGGADVTVTLKANSLRTRDGEERFPSSPQIETAQWDATIPTVDITLDPTVFNAAGEEITATFTFSEFVAFDLDAIDVTGGAKPHSGLKPFGGGILVGCSELGCPLPVLMTKVYKGEFTTTGSSGDLEISVKAETAIDVAGNLGPAATVSATATRDAEPPTLGIDLDPTEFNAAGDEITATFTFNEPVAFGLDDIDVTGGHKPTQLDPGGTFFYHREEGCDIEAGCPISASVWTGVFTTTGSSGDLVISVGAEKAIDLAGNLGPAIPVSATATRDITGPTVTIDGVQRRIANTDPFEVTFTFDEDVTGFDVTDTGDVRVTNAAIASTGTDTERVYKATVTPNGEGDVTIIVKANAARDDHGNPGPAADVRVTATYDDTAPTVTITGVPEYINDTTALTVTFTFNEDVTEFTINDAAAAAIIDASCKEQSEEGAVCVPGPEHVTVTNAAITSTAKVSPTIYTATITPDGAGDVTITVKANSAGSEENGQTGPAADVSETAEYDATAPTVGVTLNPTAFNADGAEITATFAFDEAVTGFALNDITVTGGSKPAALTTGEDGDREYTAVFTTSGSSGDMTVEVAANAVTDLANNQGPTSPATATATPTPRR